MPPGIQTEGDRFTIRPFPGPEIWPDAYQVEVPYTFTNRTGGPVYLMNCGGDYMVVLERRVGTGWEIVWDNVINLCLSPAIQIERDAEYSTSLTIYGWPPGANVIPEFEPHSGTHRLRWIDAVSFFQWDPTIRGDQIADIHKLSNEFELVFEKGQKP